jgi:hypothetical protein
MNSTIKKLFPISILIMCCMTFAACNSGSSNQNQSAADSITGPSSDTTKEAAVKDTAANKSTSATNNSAGNTAASSVLIYNFHVTNRCASCIAIEDATTKTLNTYFSKEVKEGRIKRQILNVDDEANKTISEKYQAFGSGLYVTRVFKGKETTTDLTGEGFKYAKNKEDRFIEILKAKITEYLK